MILLWIKRWGLWIILLASFNIWSIFWIMGDTFDNQSEIPDETETAAEETSISPEERRTAWLNNIHSMTTRPSLEKIDSMIGAYNPYTEYILEISGNLSQEIYPAGKEVFEHCDLWNGILEEVGFWWMAQTGQLF